MAKKRQAGMVKAEMYRESRLVLRFQRKSINEYAFLAAYYLMIVMTIFNGNRYLAGLSFVWLPSFLLLGVSLSIHKKLSGRMNALAIALIASAALSTELATVSISRSTYINLQFCILSFVIIGSVQLSDEMFRKIIRFYAFFGLALCLVLIFNYLFGLSIRSYSASNVRVSIRYFGIYKDVNYLSSFIAPAFAYYLYTGVMLKKRPYFVYTGLIFIAIFIAGSRACFLAMIVAAALVFIKLMRDREHHINKPLIIAVIIVMTLILLFIVSRSAVFRRTTNFSNYSNNARLTIWSYAMDGFYKKPLIGSGVESGSYYSMLKTRWKTHNCFIDILTGQGIIGALIMLMMFKEFFRKTEKNTAFLLVMVVCFFVPLFFVNGYECATFWVPMMLVRIMSDKCREHSDIVPFLYNGGSGSRAEERF